MHSSLKLSIMKVNSAETDICQNFDCEKANNGVLKTIHNILTEKTLKQDDDKPSSDNEYSKIESEASPISLIDLIDSSLDEEEEDDMNDSFSPIVKKINEKKIKMKFFECSKCSKKFTRKIFFLIHLKKYHSSVSSAIQRNNEYFETKLDKQIEETDQSSVDQNQADIENNKCRICDKNFKTKQGLHRHIKFVHENIKNYACSICCFKFQTSHALKNHIRTVHLNEKPFPCSLCHKKFTTKSYMKLHMVNHKKEN